MQLLLFFLIIPCLIILLRRIFVKYKIYFSSKLSKIFFFIYILFIVLYLSTFILSKYDLYWKGYRSTSFIFILLTFFTIIFYWFHTPNKFSTIISGSAALLTFILSGASLFLCYEIEGDYYSDLYYNDSKYRLENTERAIMALPLLPKLFVKGGLFERCYTIDNTYDDSIRSYVNERYISKEKIRKIEVKQISENVVSIIFYHTADTNSVRKNPLIFKVALK